LAFSFLFHLSIYLWKFWKFLCSFIFYGLEILSKNFRKSLNISPKNYRHLKSKILHKFHGLLFIFLAFLSSFFPISPIQTCEKILSIFVVLYSTDYRFYQRILRSSWIFVKKNRDIWNTKHFQNSIVYYKLFGFLVFLTSFFLFYLYIVVKKFLKFLCCFIVWIRDFIKEFCKTMVFFSKKIEIFEIQNFKKIPSFTIFFILLGFLTSFFSISTIQSCRNIMKFLEVFY